MASDVRECDICSVIFRVGEDYKVSTLPTLSSLDAMIERIRNRIERGGNRVCVVGCQYDICNHCLLRLCEVLQGLHSIRGEQQ